MDESLYRVVLSDALAWGANLADIYVEDLSVNNLGLEDSKLEEAVRGRGHGAGIRVFRGDLHGTSHAHGRIQSHQWRLLGLGRWKEPRLSACYECHRSRQRGGDAGQWL